MIKNSIDESKSDFERQVDRLVNDMNGRMIETIDNRLADSQGSLGRIVDTKIQAALREQEDNIKSKVGTTITGLWSKTQAALSELDEQMKRSMDTKLDTSVQDMDRDFNQKLRDYNQTLTLEFNNTNEETKRSLASKMKEQLKVRVMEGLSAGTGSGSVDEVTKAQVDRMKLRIDDLETHYEGFNAATNNKI